MGVTGWKGLIQGLQGRERCLCLCMRGRVWRQGTLTSIGDVWGEVSGGTVAPGDQSDFPGNGCPSNLCCYSSTGKTTLTKHQHLPNPLASLLWAASELPGQVFTCKPCLPLRIPAVLRGAGGTSPPPPPEVPSAHWSCIKQMPEPGVWRA